ncbi:MAG: HlyD family efflux transporter periplasmic adaptor subunit [Gammaproteobacteria bacterium]|nr:HlyD family efflux transporter periplasmic adaptor subunit [Gammaproteobacteria bacterium]
MAGDTRTSLFRSEAVQHQREPVRGSLLLASSPRSTLLAFAAFLIAALLLGYAWLGEFSRKAHVSGYLAPDTGLVKVYPQVPGTLLERRVEEGQRVRRGDVLAVISTERGSLSVRAANGRTLELLAERHASLEAERAGQRKLQSVREQRIATQQASLEREAQLLDDAIATHRQRLQSAEQEAARLEKLKADGYVAATQVQQERDRVLEQRGQLQVLERDRTALHGRLGDLAGERRSLRIEGEAALAALDRRIAELAQERTEHESNSDVVIAAPADGVVSTVLLQAGQQARPDAPLLSIIPDGARLEAKLLVPSHAIGFIAEQQSVALRYGAFPYQRFGHYHGNVRSIAKTLLLPGDTDLPLALKEPAYLVTVALAEQDVRAYGKRFALQPGMALDADVTLDRRSIIEWIFDPLFSLVQRT